MFIDWLNVWSISRRFIQYGEGTESSKSRLLISYYIYFLHAINIQRRCFIGFAVIIIPNCFPFLKLVLTYFFNILKVFCRSILRKSFHNKILGLSCSHLYHLSFESYRLIPNTIKTEPRAIYTRTHALFFLGKQQRLFLHFIAQLMSFICDSVKVTVSF